MNGKGDTLPAEMLPAKIDYNGVGFQLAPVAAGKPNAVIAKGQQIALPSGSFKRVYIVAASAQGDLNAAFRVGDRSAELNIQAWDGFVGQWDTRVWKDQTSATGLPQHITRFGRPPIWFNAKVILLAALSRGLRRSAARLYQTGKSCLVCLASSHAGRTQ